jgi:hypothetical protein
MSNRKNSAILKPAIVAAVPLVKDSGQIVIKKPDSAQLKNRPSLYRHLPGRQPNPNLSHGDDKVDPVL